MRNGSYLEMSFLEELSSQSIAIVGGGVTGKALCKFLQARNITPIIIDEKVEEIFGIKTRTEIPQGIDLAIVSPGWRPDHSFVAKLVADNVVMMSEIDFAWRVKLEVAPDQKWVGLTGTNGKTTTVQMLNSIFESAKVHGVACGNVGDTVIEALSAATSYDILALELSSFQIHWSHEARYEAVAVLNIAEDHIDWHGSFDEYANAKLSLLNDAPIAILNSEDVEIATRSTAYKTRKIFYSLETPAPGEIGLVENLLVDRAFIQDPAHAETFAELADIKPTVPHNVSNAMAAAGLARALGISHAAIRDGLSSFTVDHHRSEIVLERENISWVNDSKATNPHAAIASILSHEKVVWIAGGLAKGASMEKLVQRAAPRLRAAILIGTDAPLIEKALMEFAPDIPRIMIGAAENVQILMTSIIEEAQKVAEPGDAVLLAPACASMDQFTSYAHRGNLFADTVRTMVGA